MKERKKILTTPLDGRELEDIHAGDIIYLNGIMVTCRDVPHRRVVEYKRPLPVDVRGNAIIHAGPIVREMPENQFEMISIGPTTSMRMEKYEEEFIRETGVKIIIGKGAMGPKTVRGCMENRAVFCVYPAGCAVVAAAEVEKIIDAQWVDLGMPETLWVCRVKEFGPLIVAIDIYGTNLYEQNMARYSERREVELKKLCKEVGFIK